MYTIKQHRPQLEDAPTLLKFSGGLQFDACGRVDAENCDQEFSFIIPQQFWTAV